MLFSAHTYPIECFSWTTNVIDNNIAIMKKYVGPSYCRAEKNAGRVACCSLMSHGEYADGTDRQTDVTRPLHYAFR